MQKYGLRETRQISLRLSPTLETFLTFYTYTCDIRGMEKFNNLQSLRKSTHCLAQGNCRIEKFNLFRLLRKILLRQFRLRFLIS
jgi:N-acetyl-anhydromuramyl-L-alanine amidase AmpD